MSSLPKLDNFVVGVQQVGGVGHPLYKITLRNGVECVIKPENISGNRTTATVGISAQWGSKIMKNVTKTPEGNTVPLTPSELQYLRNIARNITTLPSLIGELNNPSFSWTKLPYIDKLNNTKVNPNPNQLDDIYDQMNHASFWYELGKILAVDLFIGNFDRFTPEGKWQNKGNVFFMEVERGKYKTLGIDAFDPSAIDSDLTQFISYELNGFSYLKVLQDKQERNTYCQNVINDVLKYIRSTNANRNFGESKGGIVKIMQNIKGDDYDNLRYKMKLDQGIEKGAENLKKYLKNKGVSYGNDLKMLPKGIIKRMQFLNWL